MPRIRHILAILSMIVFVTLVPTTTVLGQQDGWVYPPGKTISVVFPGGTLADYCQMLRQLNAELRVVVPESASRVSMPPVEMADVATIDALLLPGLMINGVRLVSTAPEGGNDDTQIFVLNIAPGVAGMARSLKHDYFNLDFKGGTIGDYVRAIQSASDSANIVLLPRASEIQAPSVDLKSVTVEAALSVIQDTVSFENGQRALAIEVSDHRIGDAPESMFVVKAVPISVLPEGHITNGVWSVNEFVGADGVDMDQAISVIESALELYTQPAQVRFHEQTGILLARGPEEQIEIIENVLDELKNQAHAKSSDQDRASAELRSLRERLRMNAAEIRVLEKEVELARMKLREVVERMNVGPHGGGGIASEVDIAEAELDVTRTQSQLEMAVDRMKSIGEQIEELESRL